MSVILEQTFDQIMKAMTIISTKQKISIAAKRIFAERGYEGLSMRVLAKESGVNLSNIYHYFEDKDVLLDELFKSIGKELGEKRALLPKRRTAFEALKDRITFQFESIEDVVFVLKYYLHFRPDFLHTNDGYVPSKAYLHIREVLEQGVDNEEFAIGKQDIVKEAKVITHAINGFLLEYYPSPIKTSERADLVDSIYSFIARGLVTKEVPM